MMFSHKTTLTKPLEGLLSPPLEWSISGISLMLAVFMRVESGLFLLTDDLLNVTTGALVIFVLYRFWQGLKIAASEQLKMSN